MSTTKVSALTNKGSLTGNEEILINDGGTSKKSTVTAVRAGVTDATKLPLAGGTMTGNIVMSGSETVDGRDVSADGTQLDTNTSAIATKAPIASPTFTGTVAIPNIADLESAVTANTAKTGITTSQANAITANTAKVGITTSQANAITANTAKVGITTSQANAITANTAKTSNATHTGEVTGATALTIANDVVDEANLKVSNSPTNGYFLQAQSGNTGGLTWAATSTSIADGSISTAKIADDAVTEAKLANAINTAIAANTAKTGITTSQANAITANTAKVTNATHTGDVTGATALTIAANAVTTAKIADDNVTAAKLANSINTDIATGVTANTTANAALPKAGGTMTGNTVHGDNVKDTYGTGSDLEVYHDGSDSYVKDTGTGSLFLMGSNNIRLRSTNDEDYINCVYNGAVELFHNSAKKIETTANGVTVTGTAIATTNTDTSNTGSVTLDFAANQNFVLTLTGNVTLANPSTEQVGQSGFITLIQDGTGSRTVSLGTDYETAGGSGLTLTATASATDIVPYVVAASGRILLGTPQLAFS